MIRKKRNIVLSLISALLLFAITYYQDEITILFAKITGHYVSYGTNDVPEYNGKDFVIINDNNPEFKESDYKLQDETYSDLDNLDRAGVAMAIISKDTMPKKERESIGTVKPTGWHTVKYDIVDGKYLYNRCHLIGYQLTGENANPKNLITCTRQMNTGVMLDIENEIADYIRKTNNKVIYRITPKYYNDNLLASGIELEALSIEDNGKGIKIHIYIYNVQDGIKIDYKTGKSSLN